MRNGYNLRVHDLNYNIIIIIFVLFEAIIRLKEELEGGGGQKKIERIEIFRSCFFFHFR